MTQNTINSAVSVVYPSAHDCIKGHIGTPFISYFEETDDDRSYVMKTTRCGHCQLPIGGDDYVSNEERDAYQRGQL